MSLSLNRQVILVSAMSLLVGCASYKGTIRPNLWLADFDKIGEAYYLEPSQISIGDSTTTVLGQFGTDYEVVSGIEGSDPRETFWKFTSYRARFAADPIQKYLIVSFFNGRVSGVHEVWRERNPNPPVTNPIRNIERLVSLRERGAITEEEFQVLKTKALRKSRTAP